MILRIDGVRVEFAETRIKSEDKFLAQQVQDIIDITERQPESGHTIINSLRAIFEKVIVVKEAPNEVY